MKDQFDGFFAENRKELDSAEPASEMIWNRIESSIQRKASRQKLQVWRVAAVLLAFLAIGQFVYIMVNRQQASNTTMASSRSGAFQSLEASYELEVSSLQKMVAEKQVDRSQYAVLFEELEYIDQIENDFKEDIPLANDRERLAAILIDTYEKKIKLLERLLQQIDRNEKQEKKLDNHLVPLNSSTKSLSL